MSILKKAILLFSLILSFSLGSLTKLHAQPSQFADSTFILLFNPNTTDLEIELLRQEFNSTEIWVSPHSGIRFWKVNSFPFTLSTTGQVINNINEGVEAAKDRSSVDGGVLNYTTIIPTIEKGPPSSPSDFSLCSLVPDLAAISPTGPGPVQTFKIAILDTGISKLEDSSIYYNSLFEGNYTGKDFVNDDPDPTDDHGHGTHIAGIISKFDPSALITPYEYYIYKTHNHLGQGLLSDIILALDEAMTQQVDMINMSFSFSQQYNPLDQNISPLEYQIKLAKQQGILIMASAGNAANNNDGDLRYYPASYESENIISVASVNCANKLSLFSNFGPTTVDVATYGENISGPGLDGKRVLKSGTSQSAAITTKLAMLIARDIDFMDWKEIKCKILKGSFTPNNQIKTLLLEGIINASHSLTLNYCDSGNSGGGMPDLSGKKTLITEQLNFNNPVAQDLQINYSSKEDFILDLSLFDLAGNQVIFYPSIKDETTSISVATLPVGVYVMRLHNQLTGEVTVHKIVKQ